VNLAEARAELGDRGFNGILSPARMTFYLNRALTDFEDYWPWPWLRKQITGAAPLQISDLKYVRSVFDASGNEYFGLDDGDDVYHGDIGTPTGWWIDDTSGTSTLVAYPTGSVTWTVDYVSTSAPLEADSDTPNLPESHHGVWIDLAVMRAYQDRDNFAASTALRQSISVDLQQLVEVYETRNRMNGGYRLIRAGSLDD
jgi:hypothetical protein